MQQQHSQLARKAAPYVSLSAQCAFLDVIGSRSNAYSVIDANSVLTRGREGLSFRTPLAVYANTENGKKGDKNDERDRPAVVVVASATASLEASGSSLFYSTHANPATVEALSTERAGTIIEGSGYCAALLACQRHFDHTDPTLTSNPVALALLAHGDEQHVKEEAEERRERGARAEEVDGGNLCTKSNDEPTSSETAARHIVYTLPAALVRRALLQILLMLRLPGRSPAATFTLCPFSSTEVALSTPPLPSAAAAGFTADEHHRALQSVRVSVAPAAAAGPNSTDGDGNENGGNRNSGSFVYEIGTFTRRVKRPRVVQSGEGDSCAPCVCAAASPSLQCRLLNAGNANVTLAEVDASRLEGNELASDVLFASPDAYFLSASARKSVLLAALPQQEFELESYGSANNHFVSANILSKLFHYRIPATATVVPSADASDMKEARYATLSSHAHFVSFLQKASFTFLGFLAHLSWCHVVAGRLCGKLREVLRSGDIGGESGPLVRAFLLMDPLQTCDAAARETAAAEVAGAAYSEPSADGFSSLLLVASFDEARHSQASPSSSQALHLPSIAALPSLRGSKEDAQVAKSGTSSAHTPLSTSRAPVAAVLVRIVAAREQLQWKTATMVQAGCSWSSESGSGSLHELVSQCFP